LPKIEQAKIDKNSFFVNENTGRFINVRLYDEKGMTKIAGGLNRSAVSMFVLRNLGARIVENAFGNMRIVFGRWDEDSHIPCQLAIHAGKIELHHHGLHQNQWWSGR
jgi:hypothetical protein